MRVLVTGGAGFIGTHLARRLLADGHEVLVVDNESNGSPDGLPKEVWYRKGDVTKPEEIEPAFAKGLDAVCHIAGQVSIIRAFDNPVGDLRTNTEGTLQVVSLCVKHKVPRLVYASSMTLYGNVAAVPTPESEPCLPDSYYGITKFAAERYVHSTAGRPDLDFDFSVTSLRMFSVFGPGQSFSNPYQGVLGIFSGNVLRGEPISIYGDGEQTRDFIYIGDIVDGWARALTTPGAKDKIINLGSGRPTSINQLAEYVTGAFGYKPGEYPIKRMPGRPGEQRKVQADSRLAKQVLGWEPRYSFEQGLAETVKWAKAEFASNPGADSLKARK
ncbi:MAG: NAD-dependent epimerase/dehydratase family protein [Xanthobacteraceae bacterium]|nr:NAD-dependent epimerase/dehydratase family protein [Xanthobacteraceae bacterium]QYK46262.1 MAG: NAD-dependent epimerase/dehydratase family protein [Xanthobacteraceae bacterium]